MLRLVKDRMCLTKEGLGHVKSALDAMRVTPTAETHSCARIETAG